MNRRRFWASLLDRPALQKGFWVLMGAAHAPALMKVLGTLAVRPGWESFANCVMLTLAVFFFVLKFVDVRWLRIRSDPRAYLAVALVVALLHVDLVRPVNDPTLIPECTTLVAATWLVGVSAPLRRWVYRTFNRFGPLPGGHPTATVARHTVWLDAYRPHCWLLACRLFILRAPPV